MFAYYLKLAIKSALKTRLVSVLSIIAIGLGIAVPTAILGIHHALAQDPIPAKSARLYNVRMDSWSPDEEFFDIKPGDPPKHITYRDMTGVMASELPVHHSGVAAASVFVFPPGEAVRPYRTEIRLCHSGFFPMFDAPFAYGSGWAATADERRERVAVLSHEGNTKLFGGDDSIGRSVRLGEHEYRVVGVLAPWYPSPLFYDVINDPLGAPRELFVPFDLIREPELGLSRSGDSDNWGPAVDSSDPQAVYDLSELTWIQFWVEVAPERAAAYRSFVDAYTDTQKALGRFPRPRNNRVTPLLAWLQVRDVVPPAIRALVVISLLFLVVCALNLTGLLLGKFLSTSGLIGVHRALGASRLQIFWQRLLECEIYGVAGGILGVALASLALRVVNGAIPSFIMSRPLFHVDGVVLLMALGLSLGAGLISGLYPAYRACRIAPAIQLKLQ